MLSVKKYKFRSPLDSALHQCLKQIRKEDLSNCMSATKMKFGNGKVI